MSGEFETTTQAIIDLLDAIEDLFPLAPTTFRTRIKAIREKMRKRV